MSGRKRKVGMEDLRYSDPCPLQLPNWLLLLGIGNRRYFDLLSKLPEDLKNFRPAKKILAKLQKFGENLDLRIRPHVLVKVLQDLRIWELCSPDVAVAIEVTTVSFPILTMPPVPSFHHLSTSRHHLSAADTIKKT